MEPIMASSGSNSAADKTRKDNFYSPVNFAFYAQRPYQSLPTYCSHIRLLYVRRDAVNNTLYCDLSEGKPLSEVAGSYTAISYCAGDPKSTRVLMVGGLAFNAFANLVQAIEETCCYLHDCGRCGEEKISLWVDQICINQSDSKERAEQVSFMHEIYKSAFEVAVCLTTHDFAKNIATRESNQAIKCIEQVYKDVLHLNRFLTSNLDSFSTIQDNDWDYKEETNCKLNIYLQSAVKDRDFALGWLDVSRMRAMPWFSRAWILQEYASNRCVVFLFAWQHVKGETLAAVLLAYLWSGDLPSIMERKIAQINGVHGVYVPHERHVGYDRDAKSSWLSIFSYDQKVYNTLRSKSYALQYRRSLIDLLDYSRMSIASDKRDHVYSCLSLAKQSYGIQPCYDPELSVEDLFTRVMRLLLLNTKDINLVERASTALGDHSEALPSWVPDWSQPIARADAEFYSDHDSDLHAGGDTKACIEFLDDGKILQTKGVLLDTLVAEVKTQIWCGKRTDCIHTFSSPRSGSPQPDAHVSSTPPMKDDEVWILYGSAQPFLLRKSDDHYIFLRTVHVYSIDYMEIEDGTFMEFGVDLDTETKSLRIR